MADGLNSKINERLTLFILPTEKCNFRCTYCYEDFKIGKMRRSIIDSVKKFIERRTSDPNFRALETQWFGGEPLLAADVIYELCESVRSAQSAKDKRFDFFGGMTTNGYLLDVETLTRLVGYNQKQYQISLDGFEEGHDVTRQYASGKGTFTKIWKNLLDAHNTDLDFDIVLRLHLTKDNIDSMLKLAENIAEHFGGDERFRIYIVEISNYGGENGKALIPISHFKALKVAASMETILQDAGFKVQNGVSSGGGSEGVSLTLRSDEAASPALPSSPIYNGYVCYAAKINTFVIRADGRLAKCTVDLYDPKNTVGRVLPDGGLEIDAPRMKHWLRGHVNQDTGQLACPAHTPA